MNNSQQINDSHSDSRSNDHSGDLFARLLQQHYGIVAKVSRMYCAHPDDRAELVQEIVLQLWSAFASYDSTQRFSTWMYRIALNVAISRLRKSSYQNQFIDSDAPDVAEFGTVQSAATGEDGRLQFLTRFIASLDPLNRALMLLYLEEYSHAEIAAILGVSASNVSTKISRLKQRVRRESAYLSN